MIQIIGLDPYERCPECQKGVMEIFEYRNADSHECSDCDYAEVVYYPEEEWDIGIATTLNLGETEASSAEEQLARDSQVRGSVP